jgi:hypothetical protein
MAVDRLSVTVPSELGAALRGLAEARGETVSNIVAAAIAHEVRQAALGVALAEFERKFGPMSDADVTKARAELRAIQRRLAKPRRRRA